MKTKSIVIIVAIFVVVLVGVFSFTIGMAFSQSKSQSKLLSTEQLYASTREALQSSQGKADSLSSELNAANKKVDSLDGQLSALKGNFNIVTTDVKDMSKLLSYAHDNIRYLSDQLKDANAKLNKSVIVGAVYADYNYNGQLDPMDSLVSASPSEFSLILYRSVPGKVTSLEEVATANVTNGMYRFVINVDEPGDYFVSVYYPISQLTVHRYYNVMYIGHTFIALDSTSQGQMILGPTLFLY